MRSFSQSGLSGLLPASGPAGHPGPRIGPPEAQRASRAVEILLERDHAYSKRKPDPHSGKKRIGCAVCGRGRLAPCHMGAPPSMNDGGSGMDRMAYQSLKKAWQAAFAERLEASALPRGLEAVDVEALVGFPTVAKRDGGNFRWMIEKALGDALVEGGWLEDDCFYPTSRYEFGGIQGVHSPGRSWLRLLILPRRARAQDGDAFVMPAVEQPDRPSLFSAA